MKSLFYTYAFYKKFRKYRGGLCMKDINSLEHTSWRCQYHIVFAPKHRRMEIYGQIKQDIGVVDPFTGRENKKA